MDAWDSLAERVVKHLHKGDFVQLTGSVKFDKWEDKDTGKPRSSTTMVAAHIWTVSDPPGAAPDVNMSSEKMQCRRASQQRRRRCCHALYACLPQRCTACTDLLLRTRACRAANVTATSTDLWEELKNTPDHFWDNRTDKRNPRAPDIHSTKTRAKGSGSTRGNGQHGSTQTAARCTEGLVLLCWRRPSCASN